MYSNLTKAALMAALTGFAGAAHAGEFDGGYVGVFARDSFNTPATYAFGGGAYAGYNYDMGEAIVGGEVSVDYGDTGFPAGNAITGLIDARVGMSPTAGVMVYAKGGVGYATSSGGEFVYDFGAGAEYMITDTVSLRGEFDRVAPMAGGFGHNDVKLGLGYNF